MNKKANKMSIFKEFRFVLLRGVFESAKSANTFAICILGQ